MESAMECVVLTASTLKFDPNLNLSPGFMRRRRAAVLAGGRRRGGLRADGQVERERS